MNQLPSSRWSRGVNRFPLRLQVCPGNLQSRPGGTGTYWRWISDHQRLRKSNPLCQGHRETPAARARSIRPPQSSTALSPFSFFSAKTSPPSPSRSALWPDTALGCRPGSVCPSEAMPSLWSGSSFVVDPSLMDPGGFSVKTGVRELVDGNG